MSKTGRNQICPCGSGAKYKHCCGGFTTETELNKRRKSPDQYVRNQVYSSNTTKISPEEAKARLNHWKQKALEYDRVFDSNGGKYTRSDSWYHEYCKTPYLAFASSEYLAERFIAHFHNNMFITSDGGITLRTDFAADDCLFGPLFAHLHIEYKQRGGIPSEVIKTAKAEINKYHFVSAPRGVTMFRNYPQNLERVVVKFGKQQHLQNMIDLGEIRLSPAGFYSKNDLSKAMRDLENKREFHLPAHEEIIRGQTTIKIKELTAQIIDGFLKISIECPEYLLWSGCLDIDRRMPDDFTADAALIIREPVQFAERFQKAVKKTLPEAKFWFGPVTYFDPCSQVHMKTRPEIIKHFSYAYQREWRICVFPVDGQMPTEPITLRLGALNDIAELVKG
jgi:hypothetical protein